MDASDHMLDPQWEPSTRPNRNVHLSPFMGPHFARNHLVKQLTLHLARGEFAISKESCQSLSRDLEQDGSLPGLEHVKFQPEEDETGYCLLAVVPAPSLVTVSRLAQVNAVTFSRVGIPLPALMDFLKQTAAHTLRIYHCNLLGGPTVPQQFTVSSSVKFLDIRRVTDQSAVGALIAGVLANCQRDAHLARITVNPEDMLLESNWDSIGNNWTGCQILELADVDGDFDREKACTIFQSLSTNDNYRFSGVQELRLTNPQFSESSFDAFVQYITESRHLLSLRIRGWTKFLDRHVPGMNWDMVCLLRALNKVKHQIWFVFEDAPFDALVALSQRMSAINVSLLVVEVNPPKSTWWAGEVDLGLRMVANNLVQSAKQSRSLGAIADNPKRNWANNDCNGGIWVGIKGRSFLNQSDLAQLRSTCTDNYERQRASTLKNIRQIMHPAERPVGWIAEGEGEGNEHALRRHPSGASYVSEKTTTDRVLHYH